VPLELMEETNTSGAERARVIKACAYGSSRSQANLSIYLASTCECGNEP
jgi:hypothetical protein